MAELTHEEMLQPSLLDRLTDDTPGELRESRAARVFSLARLRESVRRDLGWLLNAGGLNDVADLSAFPHVETSVINYGLADLAGCTRSGLDIQALQARIRKAIIDFEPRLLQNTVDVKLEARSGASTGLVFTIAAELWAHPVPHALLLRTEIDLENGNVEVLATAAE